MAYSGFNEKADHPIRLVRMIIIMYLALIPPSSPLAHISAIILSVPPSHPTIQVMGPESEVNHICLEAELMQYVQLHYLSPHTTQMPRSSRRSHCLGQTILHILCLQAHHQSLSVFFRDNPRKNTTNDQRRTYGQKYHLTTPTSAPILEDGQQVGVSHSTWIAQVPRIPPMHQGYFPAEQLHTVFIIL
jgi:hypothetical protein